VKFLRPTHPYIPMARGFVYLAAVVDWFSRRVLAWRLSITMEAAFCVEALEEALAKYGRPEIFNTDQGSQGGFKRSSQHHDAGGCDEHWKAAFGSIWSGVVALAWPTASSRTRRTATVLGIDCSGHVERGCRGWSRCAAGCWNQMVPKGRRHATSNVWTIGETTLRQVSLVSGTRGACDSTCAESGGAGHCPTDRAVCIDDLTRAAAQCCDA